MSTTTATRLDSPVLYQWDINDDSPRYEYPRGQPTEKVLQKFFSILVFVNAVVACSSLVLILGILRSERLRSSAFKLYVLFMAIPDFLGSFLCMVTCALSAPLSRYYSEAMCGFQSFYLVFAFCGNAWVNFVIVHEINKLLTYSKIRRRYFPPTRRQVFCHVAIIYTYALIWGILAAFPVPGIPFHTKAYNGFACFPMEQDPASTWFFYFAFLPGILLIPFFYTLYVMGRIILRKMLPKTGTSRRVSLFLMRLVIVYFCGWIPFLILAFTGNFINLNPWVSWGGAAMSHFQGFISTVVVFYTSDDIRQQMILILRCKLFESDDDPTRRQSDTRFSSNDKFSSGSVEVLPEESGFASKPRSSMMLEKEQEAMESGKLQKNNSIKTGVILSSSTVASPVQRQNKRHDSVRKNHARQLRIDSQVEILSEILKRIARQRKLRQSNNEEETTKPFRCTVDSTTKSMPRDSIAEKISMPACDPLQQVDESATTIELSPTVTKQLEDLIATYAELYHENNRFHNFDHACHVTMSANKLLQQISNRDGRAHDYTYGLTSDPMTQFAILFSTLVHDLDHSGVTNEQLKKEKNHRLAVMYGGKSIAEQNSIDLALEVLASPSYSDLVSCICADETEFNRFKQLVINCVMATDLFDKDLASARNSRWNKAFGDNKKDDDDSALLLDLKATILMEHIVQAAGIFHTMQDWHEYYSKWNEKLFVEMCIANDKSTGRVVGPSEKDPASTWYEGELQFFDNYVIPLAKKLHESGVLGATGDECLKYALENRKEWEVKGKAAVEEYWKNFNEAKGVAATAAVE